MLIVAIKMSYLIIMGVIIEKKELEI